ncbi:TonB-dependent receptor [Arcticibacter svalbardensis MN12-7]|uniref:TonB-dependent receptor n=2 Tax=Arcticibacter TaxID=1288026 RepID=R9GUG2_9SPHI|nr:TonB-dependent receptor [Arcticibacter svalbardensis MN12-7]
MKLTILLFIFALFQAKASSYAQVVTLRAENQTAEYIFSQLRAQTDYDFLCNAEVLKSITPVSINVKKMPLKDVLEKLLDHKKLTYIINDKNKTVVIKKKVAEISATEMEQTTVTGTVTDLQGDPLPGASIKLKIGALSVSTNTAGRFTILVSNPNESLVVSYIGFVTQEIPVNGRSSINVKMVENQTGLNEVVVVGYGTVKKVDLTGSVAAVKFDEKITNRALSNVSSALSGLLPGLAVSQNSGMAGNNSASLIIRGLGTVNNASPLVVVDGLPDVDINRLNMNDVESISVLKDAAAAAVYGSRAANGVILITTKTGKGQTAPSIVLSSSFSVEQPTKGIDFMADYPRALTVHQRAAAYNTLPSQQQFKNGTIDQWMALGMIDPFHYPNTDWFDVIVRDGTIQNHNLSASGGSDKSNYFISAGIMDQKGLQINNDYTRYNFRANYDAKLRHNINIGTKFSGNWSKFTYAMEEGFTNSGNKDMQYAVAGILPFDPVTGYYGGVMAYGEDPNAFNPYTNFVNQLTHRNRQEANGNVYVDWSPIKGLKARIDYALNYNNQFQYAAATPNQAYNFQTGAFTDRAYVKANEGISNISESGYKTQLSGSLNYQRTLGKNHTINALALYSEEYWYNRNLNASRLDRLYPTLHEIDGALMDTQTTGGSSYEEGLRSYVGRFDYSAYGKYLLGVSFRYDGSSKFLPGSQFSFFPSAAFKWRFSEENFVKELTHNVLSQGGLRISYGALGNNSGVGRYEQKETLGTSNYLISDIIAKGFIYQKMVNQDLTWETTTVLNLGLDLGFLKNRLTTEIDYYDRLTTDMLRPSDLSSLLTGAYTAPRKNIGNLRNRGIEGNFTWKDRKGSFDYSVNLNVSYNSTSLEEWNEYLGRGSTFLNMPYHFLYAYEDTGIAQTWQEVYDTTPQGGAPGDILRKDLNGDGRIDGNDLKAYPKYQTDRPTTNFGFNGYMAWKGFDFSMLLQGSAGRKDFWLNNYNLTSSLQVSRYASTYGHFTNPWAIDNRDGTWPQLGASGNQENSSFWVDDMSFLRVKNLQFGYKIPQRWIKRVGFDNLRLFVNAENIATFTSYRGLDPEKSSSDRDIYPLNKSLSFGLNVGF